MHHPSAAELLAWYDRHRRDLPWRTRSGEQADPYRVWLSEIMLQQTTVQAVKPYFARFLALFPTVEALADAPAEQVMAAWAGLGYYSRARNLHACAKVVVRDHGGRFPATPAGLRALPGIGPYTAGAVAAIAFNHKAAAVDGNVERVFSRLLALEETLPGARPVITDAVLSVAPEDRPGDFAQALMDLGATICTPRKPACALCPWRGHCQAHAAGAMESYPRKLAKAAGALRRGSVFLVLRDGDEVLLRTRPPKGLLGGMAELPGSAWSADHDAMSAATSAPIPLPFTRCNGVVTHTFTHFPLELAVFAARSDRGSSAPEGMRFTPIANLHAEPLPTVMRKALALGFGALGVAWSG